MRLAASETGFPDYGRVASFVTEATERTLTITHWPALPRPSYPAAHVLHSTRFGGPVDPPTMPELEAYVELAGTSQSVEHAVHVDREGQLSSTVGGQFQRWHLCGRRIDADTDVRIHLHVKSARTVFFQTRPCGRRGRCGRWGPTPGGGDSGYHWGDVSLTVSATVGGVPIQPAGGLQINGTDGTPGADTFRSYVVSTLKRSSRPQPNGTDSTSYSPLDIPLCHRRGNWDLQIHYLPCRTIGGEPVGERRATNVRRLLPRFMGPVGRRYWRNAVDKSAADRGRCVELAARTWSTASIASRAS